MQEPNFWSDGIFKPIARWGKCINVLRNYVENNGISVE
jgi:hypothetical protein